MFTNSCLALLVAISLWGPARADDVIFIGDSNTNATVADTTYGGVTVPSGYVYRHNGTTQTAWPTGNTPSVATLGPAVDRFIALGDSTGAVIRRGTNGATSHSVLVNNTWSLAVADALALSVTPEEVVVFLGANDAQNSTEAGAYEQNVRDLVDDMRVSYPNIFVSLVMEHCGNCNNYPYLENTIWDAILDIDDDYDYVRSVDSSPCDNYDQIHLSTNGHGGGHACLALLLWPN